MKEFVARYVIGDRPNRAFGVARMQMHRNIFMTAVLRIGTRLKHTENVRPALINGVSPRACVAGNGRFIMIGIKVNDV